MLNDMSLDQEKAILAILARITSITDFNTLLNVVVEEIPSIVGAVGCWIYLQPKFVPEYNGVLRRGDMELKEEDIYKRFDDFIVLAATNRVSKKPLIGKFYFGSGEGITGWVYKNGKPLRIRNLLDDQELKSTSVDLYWANEYHDGDELYSPDDERSLLVVPLILSDEPIGVLKFHARINKKPFSEETQEIATIVAQIISGVLRQTWRVAEQSQTISRLIEMSNKNTFFEVIANVTKSMKQMLNCARTEFFIKSVDGAKLLLAARNGEQVTKSDGVEVRRGENLIGWVFKTGLPLIIPNIKEFTDGVYLTNEFLERFSTSREINDENRFLRNDESPHDYPWTSNLQAISFLAVPVKSTDQEIQGVLCGYRAITAKSRNAFERAQLMLALSFSTTIALVLENEKQKVIGNLLTEIGYLTQTDQLFRTITENIPKLVASSGCSIFTSSLHHGAIRLKLSSTSQKGLILESGNPRDIEYDLGEGKTGICGLFQSVLVVNHYGKGKVSNAELDRELERINVEQPNDITRVLFDTANNRVGLFHMWGYERMPLYRKAEILNLSKNIVFQQTGISSEKLGGYIENYWSFLGIPISAADNLLGVITLSRPTPETPFLIGDISLIKSIAGRLASVLNNIRIQEERQRLVMSLAHEINTPLTGILADSENLYQEAPLNSEIQKIAKHNLEQVLRLHMQTSTIMSVLSEQNFLRQFKEHSIFRPLKEACELFESEAAQNGCDILGPRAREGGFPRIEMSLFDLTIAFKNIVHNAVKYSFRPPPNLAIHRTIKVWGEWDKEKKNYLIFIQNYGVGISREEIEKRLIFEPFYRGEQSSVRKRTGSGFGLAHARQIIEDLHHGRIDVESMPQGGDAYLTTFSIALPIKQPKQEIQK